MGSITRIRITPFEGIHSAPSIPYPLRQHPAGRIHQLNPQRHLAGRVGGAGETGIEAADPRLHPVEQGLGDLGARGHRGGNKFAGDLGHGAVHGQVVLARGDDQIHPGD